MSSLVLAIAVLAAAVQQASPGYVPERVYDTRRAAFSDFEVMLAGIAGADVVFVGEQHDDPNTHRLEAAILQGLLRRGRAATVSLEMFERDVQSTLDAYLAGRIDEAAFLAAARPWPRYATDYKPLVELASAHRWPVIGASVPRKYAAMVAKTGLGALESLPPDERAQVARDIQCPLDAYFDRFVETMNSHPMPGSEKTPEAERRATSERYYFAQCVKDETMAESIASAIEGNGSRQGPVVHFTGAFHSDFGAGVAERVRRRLPSKRVVVISILPVENLDGLAPQGDDLKRADYLIYTVKQP
jgi:uncharacterized iron-regulated protein